MQERNVFDEPLRGRAFSKFGLWLTTLAGSFAISGSYGLALDSFSRWNGQTCEFVSPFGQPHLTLRFILGITNGFHDIGMLALAAVGAVLFAAFGLLRRPLVEPFDQGWAALALVLGLSMLGWTLGIHHAFGADMPFVPSDCHPR